MWQQLKCKMSIKYYHPFENIDTDLFQSDGYCWKLFNESNWIKALSKLCENCKENDDYKTTELSHTVWKHSIDTSIVSDIDM